MVYDKAAFRKEFTQRMEEYDASHGIGRAAAAPLPAEESSSRDAYSIEKDARAEWERSAKVRAEFTCLEAYIAFRRAEARGAVRIFGRGRGA